jgi:hypothetical protein
MSAGASKDILAYPKVPYIPFWRLFGKKIITVTPNGPDDGGDFGPNTPGTTSGGVNEALAYAQANGIDIILTPDRVILVGQKGTNLEINLNSQPNSLFPNDGFMYVDQAGNFVLNSAGNLDLNANTQSPVLSLGNHRFIKLVITYNNINTVGFGLTPVYGLDNRKGITSADASPITLYTPNATNQVYKVKARINATALGTSGSATYTIKWTENGVVLSQALTVSSVNSPQSLDILIQPDANTPITAQITALTSATVNVSAEVEQVA